jgi:hypothetical protein
MVYTSSNFKRFLYRARNLRRFPASAAKRSFALGKGRHRFANMVRGDAEDLEELFLFSRMWHAGDREVAEIREH